MPVESEPRQYYVYIMWNRRHTIYTGVTNDLYRRVCEHKNKVMPGFARKYECTMLVYYETTEDVRAAIEREKQIKGWLRAKKTALIRSFNPDWRDLSLEWELPKADVEVPDPFVPLRACPELAEGAGSSAAPQDDSYASSLRCSQGKL